MSESLKFSETTGDLELDENGNSIPISGVEELAQALRSLLTTPLGSFMGYEDFGMDMSFLTGGFDADMGIEAAFDALKQDKRVTVIHSVTCTPDYESGWANFDIALSSTVGEINFGAEVPFDATN